MVSFSCDACGDVLTKGKIKTHAARCRIGRLSCLDCSTDFVFPSAALDAHTSCISEADKYGHTKQKQKKRKAGEDQEKEKVLEKERAEQQRKADAQSNVVRLKKLYKEAKKAYQQAKRELASE